MLTMWVHSRPKQASTTVSRPNNLRYQMSVHIIMTLEEGYRRVVKPALMYAPDEEAQEKKLEVANMRIENKGSTETEINRKKVQ